MTRLRLDLIVRPYPKPSVEGAPGAYWWTVAWFVDVDRWTWRLWAGSRIVSSSGSQLYSRRIDCVDGASVAGNIWNLRSAVSGREPVAFRLLPEGDTEDIEVRILDQRGGRNA